MAAVGLTVFIGWVVGSDTLRLVIPDLATMKANSAIAFTLMGAGALAFSRAPTPSGRHTIALVLIGSAMAIGLITLGEYVTGANIGIDEWLFHDTSVQIAGGILGRMSPLTAICFVVLGLAVLGHSRAPRFVVLLPAFALILTVLNAFDFAFDASLPNALAVYTGMAFPTSVTMALLALAVTGLLGDANPFRVLAGSSSTAVLLRHLLIGLVVLAISMATLALAGREAGWYDNSFATSLMFVGILTVCVVGIVGAARWAAERDKRTEVAEFERDRFFELSPDMMSAIGSDGRFQRVNAAWEKVLGYPDRELVGRQFLEFVHPEDVERTVSEAASHFGAGTVSIGFQNRYRHHDGTYRWLEWMSNVSPDLSVAYAVARDVTDRRRGEHGRARRQRVLESRNETLSEQVVRDALTGLHNRRFFDEAVVRMGHRWSRLTVDQQRSVSVILFDLDHFGMVNNQHGHQAGDTVLRVFAELLAKRFRGTDLVARYGGEEFVAVLEGPTPSGAIQIANEIRMDLEGLAIDLGGNASIHVTVSAGCAQLDKNRDASATLAMADVWLAQAKRAGRNQVVGL